MNTQELKDGLLHNIRAGRATLLEAIAGLSDLDKLRVGAVGIWSVKDALAHLTAWESELVTALDPLIAPLDPKQVRRIPHIIQIEDIDEWNMEQYVVHAPRPLDLVMEDFEGVHKHLLKTVAEIDDKTLSDPRRFPWLEGEPLSYLISEESYLHEREHASDIRNWRTENHL